MTACVAQTAEVAVVMAVDRHACCACLVRLCGVSMVLYVVCATYSGGQLSQLMGRAMPVGTFVRVLLSPARARQGVQCERVWIY